MGGEGWGKGGEGVERWSGWDGGCLAISSAHSTSCSGQRQRPDCHRPTARMTDLATSTSTTRQRKRRQQQGAKQVNIVGDCGAGVHGTATSIGSPL